MSSYMGLQKKTALVLVIVLLLTAVLSLTACNEIQETHYLNVEGATFADSSYVNAKHKKAMLFLPGLMASALYAGEDINEFIPQNTPIWTINGAIGLLKSLNKGEVNGQEFFNMLACNDLGMPNTKMRVSDMRDEDTAYDMFAGMSYMYDILYPEYGNDYDMVVWQYDWRQSNAGSAQMLEKFINENGWDEVMFFTHSMGGIVVANYLANSQANRDKTKLFVPFGAPFFGSMDAITNLFGGGSMVIAGFDLFKALEDLLSKEGFEFSLAKVARTLPSVYELLPTAHYDQTKFFNEEASETIEGYDSYIEKSSSVYVDGVSKNQDEFYEYLKQFEWTQSDVTISGQIRPVNVLFDYLDRLYVDDGTGKRVFVTELVNTQYILGVGVSTAISVDLDKDGKITTMYRSMLGDGTVPAYSASAGHSLTDENVHYVVGIEHGPLANDEPNIPKETTGLKYLLDIVAAAVA